MVSFFLQVPGPDGPSSSKDPRTCGPSQHPSAQGAWHTPDSGAAEALPGDPASEAPGGAGGTLGTVHAQGAAAPPPPSAGRPRCWVAFRGAGQSGCLAEATM